MKKVKIGIIGIGNMGSAHAKNIATGKCPELEIVAVADTNPARLDWAKENIPASLTLFNTAEEMLDSGLIEACIISTPHYDHPVLAIECMKRGIHVMVEKPAGVYVKHIREMNKVADENKGVVFGMMFNQRTNHLYRKMKEIVESGKYGEIRRTNWIITNWYRPQFYYDSGDWRATWAGEGGGVLLNQCPHQLDLWQWICGMPKKILAKALYGKWHNIEVEDDVTIFAEYENGATGVFVTTTGDAAGTNRFEIQLDRAKLVVENDKLYMKEFDEPESEFTKHCKEPFGCVAMHDVDLETDGQNPQHIGVLNAFAAAILRGEPLVADGREGINGVTISNAAHLSSWLNREIEIPFDEDLHFEELQKRIKTSKIKTGGTSVFANTADSYAGSK